VIWPTLPALLIISAVTLAQGNTIDKALFAKANSGDADAQHRLSLAYSLRGDSKESCRWEYTAARNGSTNAQIILAQFYENGTTWCDIAKDGSQAAFWFSKAAEKGEGLAQDELAFLYYNGDGIPQDYSQAAWWWRKAAEQRYEDAQYNLGYLYLNGLGVPQDYAEAYFWVNIAISGKLTTVKPEVAAELRDEIASHLTRTVLLLTQQRARKWTDAHSAYH
jgi:uncharacterized protein